MLICRRIWERIISEPTLLVVVTTVNFSSPADGTNSTSVVSVPTSPLIVQVFPTGQSGATNSAEHRFSFSLLENGGSEAVTEFQKELV